MIWRTFRSPNSNALVRICSWPLAIVPLRDGLGEQAAELVFGVRQAAVRVVGDLDAGEAEQAVAGGVEQPDERVKQVREDDQRRREEGQEPVGIMDRPVLRGLSPTTTCSAVLIASRSTNAMACASAGQRMNSRASAEQRIEQRRDGGLGDGAQAEAGDRDAELAGGEVQIELALDLQRKPGEKAGLRRRASSRHGPRPTAANSAATK